MAIPKSCFWKMWSIRSWRSGITGSKPFSSLLAISRRKTPDFTAGSIKVASLIQADMKAGMKKAQETRTPGVFATSGVLVSLICVRLSVHAIHRITKLWTIHGRIVQRDGAIVYSINIYKFHADSAESSYFAISALSVSIFSSNNRFSSSLQCRLLHCRSWPPFG